MIFFPTKLHHKKRVANTDSVLPETFGILCWNVHKNNLPPKQFASFIYDMAGKCAFSIALLQEASIVDDSCLLSSFSYDAAANLQVGRRFFGVLTASLVESESAYAFLSRHTEGVIGTRKSVLMTVYPAANGKRLMVVNVHAINFRGDRVYRREIEELIAKASNHEGPLIVAGDFNAWNTKRAETLRIMEKKLALSRVDFGFSRPKSFRGYPLDFVFYRGLCQKEASIISSQTVSDHHPLLVTFEPCD